MLSLAVGRGDQSVAQSVSDSYFLLLSFLCSFVEAVLSCGLFIKIQVPSCLGTLL